MFCKLSVLHSNPTQPSDLKVSTCLVPMRQYFTAVNHFGSCDPGRKVYSKPFIWEGEGHTGTRQNICQDFLALSQDSEVCK